MHPRNTPSQTSARMRAAADCKCDPRSRDERARGAALVNALGAALVAVAATLVPLPAQVFATQDAEFRCGDIRLVTAGDLTTDDPEAKPASTNNAAARMLSDIDQLILEAGFNCSVENTTANNALPDDSTLPAFASAALFNPPEPSTELPDLRSINSSPLPDAGPGWWINADAVEKHPELVTVLDVLEHPELFADSGPGLFVGCPVDSDCQHINTNLFRAFQMQDKGWQQVTPANQAELDASLLQTVEQGQNWFGYYDAPAAVMARLDLTRLEFGIEFAGAKNWNSCIIQPVDDCADPRPTGWQPSTIHTVINQPMADNAPRELLTYLSSRVIPVAVMASLMAEASYEMTAGEMTTGDKTTDNKTADADMAELFIRRHRELWSQWLPDDVANRVAEAVAPLH